MQKSLFITRYLSTLLSKLISGVEIIGASPTPVLYEPNPSQSQSTAEVRVVTLRSWSRMVQLTCSWNILRMLQGISAWCCNYVSSRGSDRPKEAIIHLPGLSHNILFNIQDLPSFNFSSEQGAYRVISHLRGWWMQMIEWTYWGGERQNWRLRVFMQSRISKWARMTLEVENRCLKYK